MALKKGDFAEIEYTGRLDTGDVFDTTDEEEAKKAGIHRNRMIYGRVGICIGEQQILKGIDEALEGKEPGKHTITLPPEKAFGKKQAKLVQMIPLAKFKQQNVQPMPGLQLNIDGMLATIKAVSGGRILVDFNHPLSGHEVTYTVRIIRTLEKPEEKVKALAELHFNRKEIGVSIRNDTAELSFATDIPKDVAPKLEEAISTEVSRLVPEIKKVVIKMIKTAETKKQEQEHKSEKTHKQEKGHREEEKEEMHAEEEPQAKTA